MASTLPIVLKLPNTTVAGLRLDYVGGLKSEVQHPVSGKVH